MVKKQWLLSLYVDPKLVNTENITSVIKHQVTFWYVTNVPSKKYYDVQQLLTISCFINNIYLYV